MQVHGVNTHQHEPQTVPAVRATRQVREAEEAPFVVVLVLGDRRRSYELAHQSARGAAIRLDQRRLLVGPVRIPQRAMHHVKRVPKLLLLGYTGLWVRDKQLDDWRGVYHSSITLTKPTGSCCDGLLSHSQFKVQVSGNVSLCFTRGSRHEVAHSCSLYTGCGMDPGNGIARTSFRGGGPGAFGSGYATDPKGAATDPRCECE